MKLITVKNLTFIIGISLIGIGLLLMIYRENLLSKLVMTYIFSYENAKVFSHIIPWLHIILGIAILFINMIALNVLAALTFLMVPSYNLFIIISYGKDECGCMTILPTGGATLQILVGLTLLIIPILNCLKIKKKI